MLIRHFVILHFVLRSDMFDEIAINNAFLIYVRVSASINPTPLPLSPAIVSSLLFMAVL